MIQELSDVQVDLENAEQPEIKLPTTTGSRKAREFQKKKSASASLTIQKPLTVWITAGMKIVKRNIKNLRYADDTTQMA